MANDVAILGREVAMTLGGSTIAGKQTKGLTVNNERIEVGDDDSGGWTVALAKPGQKSVECPISGIVKDLNLLRSIISNASQKYALLLTYPDGSTVAGDFFLGNYSETGEYNGAYTFDITLSSSAAIVFTAGT